MSNNRKQYHKEWYKNHRQDELTKKQLRMHGDKSLAPMYIASCSFGKDSLATILLAIEHNEPIDRVAFCEVMYDHSRNISGEMPEHIQWIEQVAIPKLQAMGLTIDTIRAKMDYMQLFTRKIRSGRHTGMTQGFPMMGGCIVESYCKKAAIHAYYRQMSEKRPLVEYVGIAADETNRLKGIHNSKGKISLLEKYGYTEAMAKELCKQHGLLSPIYDKTIRTGCWFCPNRRKKDHAAFAKEQPQLWNELLELGKTENMVGRTFVYGETIEQYNRKLIAINAQQTLF